MEAYTYSWDWTMYSHRFSLFQRLKKYWIELKRMESYCKTLFSSESRHFLESFDKENTVIWLISASCRSSWNLISVKVQYRPIKRKPKGIFRKPNGRKPKVHKKNWKRRVVQFEHKKNWKRRVVQYDPWQVPHKLHKFSS